MSEKEKIEVAKMAIDKKMSYENLRYSDYMYGMESETESVWEYVEECEEIGTKAFYEKYRRE